jgi:hypothetical protein
VHASPARVSVDSLGVASGVALALAEVIICQGEPMTLAKCIVSVVAGLSILGGVSQIASAAYHPLLVDYGGVPSSNGPQVKKVLASGFQSVVSVTHTLQNSHPVVTVTGIYGTAEFGVIFRTDNAEGAQCANVATEALQQKQSFYLDLNAVVVATPGLLYEVGELTGCGF